MGWLREGRWPLPCKVERLCPPPAPRRDLFNSFPPLFIRTLVLNACRDSSSHLKYSSNVMPANFLCYSKSLIITVPNGAFGQLKFASALFELAEMFRTSQKFNNTYATPVHNISIAACYQIWKENALMRARSFPKWYSNVFLRCLNFWGSIRQVVWYMELMYMLAEGGHQWNLFKLWGFISMLFF